MPVARFEKTLKLTPAAVTEGPRGALPPASTTVARLVVVASFIFSPLLSHFEVVIVAPRAAGPLCNFGKM